MGMTVSVLSHIFAFGMIILARVKRQDGILTTSRCKTSKPEKNSAFCVTDGWQLKRMMGLSREFSRFHLQRTLPTLNICSVQQQDGTYQMVICGGQFSQDPLVATSHVVSVLLAACLSCF